MLSAISKFYLRLQQKPWFRFRHLGFVPSYAENQPALGTPWYTAVRSFVCNRRSVVCVIRFREVIPAWLWSLFWGKNVSQPTVNGVNLDDLKSINASKVALEKFVIIFAIVMDLAK